MSTISEEKNESIFNNEQTNKQKRLIKNYLNQYTIDVLRYQLQNIIVKNENYTVNELKYLAKSRIKINYALNNINKYASMNLNKILDGSYTYDIKDNDLINEGNLFIYKCNNDIEVVKDKNKSKKQNKKNMTTIEEILA